MGQFKPMVKMMTTEPSVELKLKTGGSASFKRMHSEGAKEGFKPVKKMNGGVMGALSRTHTPTTPMGNPTAAKAMASKMARPVSGSSGLSDAPVFRDKAGAYKDYRKALRNPTSGSPNTVVNPSPIPPRQVAPSTGSEPAVPKPTVSGAPAPNYGSTIIRKKGGGVEAKLEKHADMPASKAHKGLKTGGIAKSTKPGGYKTGGVVDGQGGFKSGGSVPASGIIKTMAKKTTKVVGAKPNHNSAPTGDVKMGNAGGYKKGGATKKHFATGGAVNSSGHAVAMPKKAPSKPVAITELSGTFKKGGRVC